MSELRRAQVDPDAQIFPMSVMADLSGVHPQTLRVYERAGLLEPHRTGGNIRMYSLDDILRARRIRTLTSADGVNLAGAEVIVELEDQIRLMLVHIIRIAVRVQDLDGELTDELRELGRQAWAAIDPGPHDHERRELAARALDASAAHPHARRARELGALRGLPPSR